MEESGEVSTVSTTRQSMQLLSPRNAVEEEEREGAVEQNGSSNAKKQSSSSQTEGSLVAEQQQSLTGYSSSGNLGPPSGGMQKSSSSGSIPSSSCQRSVSKTTDRAIAVRERRLQIEEERRQALKKQVCEREVRRQRAQEVRVKSQRPQSAKVASKRHPAHSVGAPSIVVQSVSPEPDVKQKSRPPQLSMSTLEAVGSPKGAVASISSPSPLSPRSSMPSSTGKGANFVTKKAFPTKKKSPPSNKSSPFRKHSPTERKQSPPGKKVIAKKLTSSVGKARKQPPMIPEISEPEVNDSEQLMHVDSDVSITELSIYYNKPSTPKVFSETDLTAEDVVKEVQRRVTLPVRPIDHFDERKCSHPNMKFPEKVEYSETPRTPYKGITSREMERRKKEYKPRPSAAAFCASMRPDGTSLMEPLIVDTFTGSAPVSRVTTPASSRSSSPKRHASAVVRPTIKLQTSPLIARKSSQAASSSKYSAADDDEVVTSRTSSLADIDAPPIEQLSSRRRTLSGSSDQHNERLLPQPISIEISDEDSSNGISSYEFPPSYSELRPQESCLYALFKEGTSDEIEECKMVLSEEQFDHIGEIYLLPNSLEWLIAIVPPVQQYLYEGAMSFKVLSSADSDGSRSSFIIRLPVTPSSGSHSSSEESVLSFEI